MLISACLRPTSTKAALPESVADENTIEVTNLAGQAHCDVAATRVRRGGGRKAALPGWAGLTVKRRAQIMLRFHALIEEHCQELADLIVRRTART